ncbi:hypothetical protein TCAL_14170, partial [Tigriopus californicus]
TFFALSALLAVTVAAPADPYHPAPYHPAPSYHDGPAYYNYGYAVHDDYSGTNFQANENSDGHGTKGQYSVLLPDGRTQTVTYTADDYTGYLADVKYDGYGKPAPYHPAPAPYHPAPAPYHPAPAPYHPAPYHPTPAPYHTAPYHAAPYHPAPYHEPFLLSLAPFGRDRGPLLLILTTLLPYHPCPLIP